MLGTVAIVGAGQIGYAARRWLQQAGYNVRVLARTMPAWLDDRASDFTRYVASEDRAPKADVVLDTIAFDAGDISRYDPDQIGRLIVVSSASVYRDPAGRTLDEAARNGFPEFAGPVVEDHPTLEPGPDTYSTRKVRMERAAIARFGNRATVLRPCAIHGPHSRHPREWWFVKRMLDGRQAIPLAHGGRSRFQTTATGLIGEFVVMASRHALGGIYNIADADSPNVREIGAAIAHHLNRAPSFIPIEGDGGSRAAGRTPWSVPRPFVTSGAEAMRDGSLTRMNYFAGVESAVRWLEQAAPGDWRSTFPQLAAYPWELFDYEAEDALMERL